MEPRSKLDPPTKTDSKHSEEKVAKREFTLPKPVVSSSPAPARATSSATSSSSLKQQQQQQLSELALLQQLNAAAGLPDPATAAALFGIPPELLPNLTPGKHCFACACHFSTEKFLTFLNSANS